MTEATRGSLVVATPGLADPNFAHSVVLLLDNGDDGALGVILNRPTEIEVVEALPVWYPIAAEPPVVFEGGPVEPSAVLALGRSDVDADRGTWRRVTEDIGIVDLSIDPSTLDGLVAVRVFAGYSGWAPGQLEGEIEAGGWFVLETRPDDPFVADPDGLWQDVLRRQGGVYVTASEDPSLN
ncbi:MAG: YqgE/AlgH family protein [Actinobacteria bacterium]|nr:YqgE/AlgH family protein [Actinomycetota bacterium]